MIKSILIYKHVRENIYVDTNMYHFRNMAAMNSQQLSVVPKKQLLHQSNTNSTIHSIGTTTITIDNTITSKTKPPIMPLVRRKRLIMLLKYFFKFFIL